MVTLIEVALLSLGSAAVLYPMLRFPRLFVRPPEVLMDVPNYTFDFGGLV